MTTVVCRIVEICVFRFLRDTPEFLLLKRSGTDPVHPGMWQIVTGSQRENETATIAALRELKEETGLVPDHFWVVPGTVSFYDPVSDAVNIAPFFAAQVPAGQIPMLSAEHTAFEWLPFETAWRRLVWPGQRDGVELVRKYIIAGGDAARLTTVPLQ